MNIKALAAGLLVATAAGGIAAYTLLFEDMTGADWADIEQYKADHPRVTVTYKVPVDDSLTLSHSSTEVTLTSLNQVAPLTAAADYLQGLQTIRLEGFPMTGDAYAQLTEAFPAAVLDYDSVTILDTDYPADTTELDLSHVTEDTAEAAALAAKALPKLQRVDLMGGQEQSSVTIAAVTYLAQAIPQVEFNYTFELFGQTVSTDMERLEYFQVDIGDEGLEQFRAILPIMRNLTYLKLDWCGTSDEAMAQLREEYKDKCKVVWRVFMNGSIPQYNMLTDTYKIWVQYDVTDEDTEVLKYCNEVRYMDIGHTHITNCEFARYMPHLNTLVMSISQLNDLEPLRSCPELNYLEIFMTKVTDLSPLADLKQLEYLNIGDIRTDDLTPLFELKQLRKLLSVKNYIPEDMAQACRDALPDTNVIITDIGDYVMDHQWRFGRETADGPYGRMPRYALLREQIRYYDYDYSAYPGGYLDHEVTYESTGISPPINNA